MHFWTLYSVHSLKFLFTFSFSFNREGWPQSFMSKTDCRSGGRAPLTKLLYLGNENVLILSAITWTSFCPFDSNPCHYIIDIWDLTYIMTPVSSLCGLSFCSLPLVSFLHLLTHPNIQNWLQMKNSISWLNFSHADATRPAASRAADVKASLMWIKVESVLC